MLNLLWFLFFSSPVIPTEGENGDIPNVVVEPEEVEMTVIDLKTSWSTLER